MHLIVSLALTASCTLASAAEPALILKSGHFTCPASQAAAVETMADAADLEHVKEAFVDAYMHGRCGGSLAFSVAITQVRAVRTRGGHTYRCFHELDLASGAADLGESCTLDAFVTTIAAEVAHRRGDYTVAREDAKRLEARCADGGVVIIEKRADHWDRAAVVFPRRLDPPLRAVPADRETALRDGCRGDDYVR
ncbi:hypothetical protein [Scleromatobacter humisilvae]|uniref:Uncharacterized protein n=1 Tax=Scleromatobacter humisilvae TaxID=2897159 RepID=A0A9X2BX95_9BURK|nr:hypothetical protein [Scleromatobacter humisilvae]MCK9684197.1 hypothetical protein [Scleromatobacter humisilvae]